MDEDAKDYETFAYDGDADAGDLPAFFGKGTGPSGDQEFSSLMQELNDAALAEAAGADSGAGGLEGLHDSGETDVPTFFKLSGAGTPAREGDAAMFHDLSRLSNEADHSDVMARLLEGVSAGELRRNNDEGNQVAKEDEEEFSAGQSEWALMQKQFEDMSRSLLEDYHHVDDSGAETGLNTEEDEGERAALETMRQLSLDDVDNSDLHESADALPRASAPTPATATHAGPSLIPPGARTLEELEAELANVSIGSSSGTASMSAYGWNNKSGRSSPTESMGRAASPLGNVVDGANARVVPPTPRTDRTSRGSQDQLPPDASQSIWLEEQQHQQQRQQQQQQQERSPLQQIHIGHLQDVQPTRPQDLVTTIGSEPSPDARMGRSHASSAAPYLLDSRSGHEPKPIYAHVTGSPSPQPHHSQQQQHPRQARAPHPGYPPRLGPGMPAFNTLPPHVQAHLLQQHAMAHGGRGPPPPPPPPQFRGIGFSPMIPPQQQQQQQPQHHQGAMLLPGPAAVMPRGPAGPTGVPMMARGQHFAPDVSSGLVVRGTPPPPMQPFNHQGPPARVTHVPPPSQGKPDARPPLPPVENFPRGELMTPYDTRYVIMAQMRALETPDPFNDDFYYHNAMRRKQEKDHRSMLMGGGDAQMRERPPAMPIPLPVWQETKEIAKKVKDEQADAVKKRIRQWESENRVLGHHARADVHRPRALLVLSGDGGDGEDGESGSNDGDVMVSGGAPFETYLWKARLAIQRATNAMLAAYELNYSLRLPTTSPAEKAEVAKRLGQVITDLAVSLGLKRSIIMQQAEGKSAPDASTLEASLDLRVLSTVLELTKGQKLLSRCLVMLPPGQRSALVPSVLALILARAPASSLRNAASEQVKADAIKAEEALAHELKAVVQSPASLPLPILRRCIELVMTAHRGRGSLAAALGSVSRAEVLGAVLKKGGEMSEAEGGEAATDWAKLQAEFISMAKEEPQAPAISAH